MSMQIETLEMSMSMGMIEVSVPVELSEMSMSMRTIEMSMPMELSEMSISMGTIEVRPSPRPTTLQTTTMPSESPTLFDNSNTRLLPRPLWD